MTNDERSPRLRTATARQAKPQGRRTDIAVLGHLIIRHSFGLRHWEFVILFSCDLAWATDLSTVIGTGPFKSQ
ncbi:MAG: hypothetical protein DME55_09020 [Verrucomicrobia bacterium]|nr:MAG: hypothetical protein DME55_09020 [Verrucomicrobiota bacterium]